jgi:hypothetical protein
MIIFGLFSSQVSENVAGCRLLALGYGFLVAGFWIMAIGYKIQDTRYRM